jgi:predicted dehydrogenase
MAKHTVMENPIMPNVHGNSVFDTESQPRKDCLNFLIIGAGARGNAYAAALTQSASSVSTRIGAIAEPIISKRNAFQRKYVREHETCQLFDTWQAYVELEKGRQRREVQGERIDETIDGVFVCTLDELHAEIITALAPLGLHILSEKPLATTLRDCLSIYRSLQPPGTDSPQAIFSIGHVLRYSPHNMLLRKLLLDDGVIGDVLSIEHTEPVGWWHFSHSYVR